MREVVLRVPADAVEDVLDRLLPVLPDGVRERYDGRSVDLVMRGPGVPGAQQLTELAAAWPYELAEHEVSEDWRERRLADYQAEPIAGRRVVRPEWAPPPAEPAMIDLPLTASSAFGTGTHPTTRTCLELMLGAGLAPGSSFAFGDVAAYEPGNAELSFDLGAGSDRVTVRGTLATLSFTERGTVRVTAQAIVRQAPAS